jgi:hypothetical protein
MVVSLVESRTWKVMPLTLVLKMNEKVGKRYLFLRRLFNIQKSITRFPPIGATIFGNEFVRNPDKTAFAFYSGVPLPECRRSHLPCLLRRNIHDSQFIA